MRKFFIYFAAGMFLQVVTLVLIRVFLAGLFPLVFVFYLAPGILVRKYVFGFPYPIPDDGSWSFTLELIIPAAVYASFLALVTYGLERALRRP